MNSLGSFGRRYDRVERDFDYFGETIRVNPDASKITLVEFMAEAGGVDQADEVRAAQLIIRTMREAVHPDDWDRFWTIAKRERQDPQEDLMPIAQAVLEAVTGFPTGPASGSTAGPATTSQRFTVDLPSQAVPGPVLNAQPSTADKALAMLRGRPDLQEFVVKQEEVQNGRPVLT